MRHSARVFVTLAGLVATMIVWGPASGTAAADIDPCDPDQYAVDVELDPLCNTEGGDPQPLTADADIAALDDGDTTAQIVKVPVSPSGKVLVLNANILQSAAANDSTCRNVHEDAQGVTASDIGCEQDHAARPSQSVSVSSPTRR